MRSLAFANSLVITEAISGKVSRRQGKRNLVRAASVPALTVVNKRYLRLNSISIGCQNATGCPPFIAGLNRI